MCITSNVLVIFISFEIFNIISCEIVVVYLIDFTFVFFLIHKVGG